jgi:hypothetical protein
VYTVVRVMIYYAVLSALYNTYLNFSSRYFYCLPFLLAFESCPPLSSMIVPHSVLKSYDALLFNHDTSCLSMFCPFSVITLTRTGLFAWAWLTESTAGWFFVREKYCWLAG